MWNYLKDFAQLTESDYPYSNATKNIKSHQKIEACKLDSINKPGVVKTNSTKPYFSIGTSNAAIASALKNGPASAAIDASSKVF